MPIIDPSLQCFLIKSIEETEGKDDYSFILKYLQIAMRNLNRNSSTIEASIIFKRDFSQSISIINEHFGCNFQSNKIFDTIFQQNCYKYFYKHIKLKNKEEESKKYKGKFKICNDLFNTRFFQPYIFYSKFHSWHFTDTPIAILSIDSVNLNSLNKETKYKIIQFIKLEIDLISASGLTLVFCFNYSSNSTEFLTKLMKDDQFSEIHCNIFKDNDLMPFLKFQSQFHFLRGYFYLYCHFVEKETEERILMKKFKQKVHTTVITFSKSPEKSFKKLEFIQTKPFPHCKTGFKYEYLRIFVNYIPIFDSETDEDNFIPSDFSTIYSCYISPNDFLRKTNKRVKIMIDNELNKDKCQIKYINFEDIHHVRSEFYVEDGLLLTKMDEGEIGIINRIKDKVDLKVNNVKKFRRMYLLNLLLNNKYQECLQYVTYVYSRFIRSSIPDFAIHRAQIYAAFEACKTCFKIVKDPNEKETKGVIYQVETGEGKSCIVCLIAAVLAIKKYTVHIASSNIKLSNRDYYNSYDFFRLLGLKSAVLLHKNELPYKNTEPGRQQEDRNEEEDENDQSSSKIPLIDVSRDEEDTIFKSNADYYYEVNAKKSNESYRKSYPDEFFGDELFKNSSKMNFSVCGIDNDNNITKKKNRANVIFSTFVNFECFYLHLMEMCPAYIEKYFKKCSLLIDEADSILIDEIKNGTIVSREIKSNAKEILTFVYKQKVNGIPAEKTYNELKENPMCSDIKLSHIEEMYKEIDIVNSPEYTDGGRYKIETFQVRNNHRIRNLIKKTIKNIIKIPEKLADIIESKMLNDENDDEEYDEDDEDELDTRSVKEFTQVIPFDNKNKGILEPNKEFSGFIHQFISLKEILTNNNENLIFKDISMSYLYISHPIFTNLYRKICGFTGTVGNSEDKKIYKEHYSLITKKIPRNKPSLRVNLPMIICSTIEERDEKIVSEVIQFHEKGNPVIVIFQNLGEIEKVQKMLFERGIHFINIFNGIDEYVLPDRIAGIKGAVSLGSNYCGRGTDIQFTELPLHVIVSFHSSNVRVMNQAFGRTARQGQKGTCRCICVKEQYLRKMGKFNIDETKEAVDEFEYKINAQQKFIEHYKKDRPWIFDFNIGNQKIQKKYIKILRRSRLNVNRIVAYNFKFPVCMSIKTFLKIQSQKIFSLFNCPNSKYTWRLFQRYVREMILQSWSIMIQDVDQKHDHKNFKKELDCQIKNLHEKIQFYLPLKKHIDIVSTFAYIYSKVHHKYKKIIFDSFPKIGKAYLSFGESRFTLFQLGFKPYSLLSRSGARINSDNIDETNFIEDPELKYQRKMPDNSISFLSITERIDSIFNSIFQKISSILGEKVYLKFFLRRTLAGCEFGVCFDIHLINSDDKIQKDKYILIDKDPLLVFTIFLWSMAPLMAGILIFVLVYVTGLVKKVITWVEAFPAKITKEVVKQGVIAAINLIVPETANFFLERIIGYLEKVLDKQIKKLSDEKERKIVEEIKKLLLWQEFERSGEFISDKISSLLGGIIKISEKVGKIIKESVNVSLLLKIGLLLLLCLGTYMKSFMSRKDAIDHAESNAKSYNSTFDEKKVEIVTEINDESNPSDKELDKILENEKIDIELDEMPKLEKEKIDELEESYKIVSETYIYKFKTQKLSKYQLNLSDFKNKLGLIGEDHPFRLFKIEHISTKEKYIKLVFSNYNKEDTINIIRLYAISSHPAISHFVGFSTKKKDVHIFLKDYNYLFRKTIAHFSNNKNPLLPTSLTEKYIISYGLACALEFLHNRKVYNVLIPHYVFLDSQLYPYIFNLNNLRSYDIFDSRHDESIFYIDTKSLIENEHKLCSKCIVFSYGMILFDLFFEISDEFAKRSLFIIQKMLIDGIRPQFPDTAPSNWRNLIERCWQEDHDARPSFTEICDLLESGAFLNPDINIAAFNNYMKIVKPFRPK